MEIKKIGEVNYNKFKIEIKLTPKTKEYIENQGLSLAILIPNAYQIYEQLLFDSIDENEDGIPDKKFGKEFVLIHYGITEGRGWNIKEGVKTEGFKENLKLKENPILHSGISINKTPKNPNKKFIINYLITKK